MIGNAPGRNVPSKGAQHKAPENNWNTQRNVTKAKAKESKRRRGSAQAQSNEMPCKSDVGNVR